jgi:hypothetical protein
MTMSITDHIKNTTSFHQSRIKMLNRGFTMFTSDPLKETHEMCRKNDLVK